MNIATFFKRMDIAYKIANEARKVGKDPKNCVEIPQARFSR